MLSLKEVMIDSLLTMKTIKDLANYILENDMASLFKDILTACIIFISLPVTVASAERSFSKLKIIKNYLRKKSFSDFAAALSALETTTGSCPCLGSIFSWTSIDQQLR